MDAEALGSSQSDNPAVALASLVRIRSASLSPTTSNLFVCVCSFHATAVFKRQVTSSRHLSGPCRSFRPNELALRCLFSVCPQPGFRGWCCCWLKQFLTPDIESRSFTAVVQAASRALNAVRVLPSGADVLEFHEHERDVADHLL